MSQRYIKLVSCTDRTLVGGNAPSELSSFVGREEEIARLTEVQSHARILTLVGPGGVGKSRVALRVAMGVSSRYTDGTWMVDLALVQDPGAVPQAVDDVLGISPSARQSARAAIIRALGDKRMLLVLDNLEHVRKAGGDFVSALSKACPEVDVIVTSREPLGIAGERVWRLAPLSLPDPAEVAPARLRTSEAVQLFLARALERAPRFELSDRNLRLIADICRRLDGLPLAIELAAARVESFDLADFATRLNHGLALRITGPRSAHARHQTLRATIAWSHSLMPDADRIVFRRLAVFARDWTLPGAMRVCSDGEVPAAAVDMALGRLVASSLVVRDDGERSRFRMLMTIREYAYDQLVAAEEAEDLHVRHAEYMLQLAEAVDPETLSADHVAVLESEQDELRVALKRAIEANKVERALRLARATYMLWYLRGHYAEGRAWFEQVLALPDTLVTRLRRDCELYLLQLRILQGDYAAAHVRLDSSTLEIHQRLGTLALFRCDPEQAREFLTDAVPRLRAAGLPTPLNALFNLGIAAVELGTTDLALSCATGCESASTSGSHRVGRAAGLLLRGAVAATQGTAARAEELLREALRLERSLGFRNLRITATIELAHALLDQNRVSEAQELLVELVHATYEASERLAFARGVEASARSLAVSQPVEAVRLNAAAAALRERLGVLLWPRDAERLALWQQDVRSVLGPKRYETAWAAGLVLTESQAVESLRAALQAAPRPGRDGTTTLTPREMEVAHLLAAGRSTVEIANELIISVSTVRVHVEHIMAKLDLHTRTEVVLWVREHDVQSTHSTNGGAAAAQ